MAKLGFKRISPDAYFNQETLHGIDIAVLKRPPIEVPLHVPAIVRDAELKKCQKAERTQLGIALLIEHFKSSGENVAVFKVETSIGRKLTEPHANRLNQLRRVAVKLPDMLISQGAKNVVISNPLGIVIFQGKENLIPLRRRQVAMLVQKFDRSLLA
jgi:hypothetical protein